MRATANGGVEEDVDGVSLVRYRHYVPRPPRGARRLLSELTLGLRQVFAHWGRHDTLILVSPALFGSALVSLRARLGRHRGGQVMWVQDIYTLGLIETGEGGALAR